jgi:hypothetical protein
MSKEMLNILMTFIFTCLAFSACPEPSKPLKYPRKDHVFFPKRFSNHFQGLRLTCSEIRRKFDVLLSDP